MGLFIGEIFKMSSAAGASFSVFGRHCEGFCQGASRHVLQPVGFAFGVQQNGRPYLVFALACNKDN